jgi:hypothetical protein
MAIDGTIGGSFTMNDRRTVGLNTGANIAVNFAPSFTFADGVGALQANLIYHASLALTAGVFNFDLAGALTDAFGTSVALARVKALLFSNDSATNIMTLGNHATAAWATWLGATSTLIVRPGGIILAVAPDATGWAVTATTGDILKIAGTGTDAFRIAVAGGLT